MTKCLQLRTCAPSSPAHPPLHLELFTILLFGIDAYITVFHLLNISLKRFPHSSVGKESACNAGDSNSIPGSRRCPGEGKGYPLQYSGLENSMDYIVCGVTKSQTQLSNSHFHGCIVSHCVYICSPSSLSIPLLMDALVASIVLAIVNNAAVNTGVHVSV